MARLPNPPTTIESDLRLYRVFEAEKAALFAEQDRAQYEHKIIGNPPAIHQNAPRLSLVAYESLFDQLRTTEGTTEQQRILSDFLLQLTGLSSRTMAYPGRVVEGPYTVACKDAEEYFARSVRQIAKEAQQPGQPENNEGLNHISVYHSAGDNARPLLLRKDQNEPTALSLVPIDVNGVVIPAGTIVAVPKTDAYVQDGEECIGEMRYGSYVVPEEIVVAPHRIHPAAFEGPIDRSLYGVWTAAGPNVAGRDKRQYEAALAYDMTDFVAAAHAVAELCSVNAGQLAYA